MMQTLIGMPAAPGRAAGPVMHWRERATTSGARADAATPLARLAEGFRAADARLAAAITGADDALASILTAQRLMLDDPELRNGAHALVAAGMDPAEAVTTVAGQLAALLAKAASDYFRARAIDVRGVGTLVAEALAGQEPRTVPAGVVVVAAELAPLDTAELARAGVAALVTINGGPTCHAAIMARAWGIPSVIGVPATVLDIPDGATVLVDGTAGRLIVDPSGEELSTTGTADVPPDPLERRLARRIPVYANIGSVTEAERAAAGGAEGIGLLRTEFLFLHRATAPTEDEQTAQYAAILSVMAGRPVIVRTLDIGADKPAPFLPLPAEPNPQLGLRGIRLCLREEELLRTQLRALVRAATSGPLKILLPMVTSAAEVTQVRALLTEAATQLGLPAPPLGVMIEVPMAALSAPELAAVSDFFSLGTNDLLQFLLAADRQHAGVSCLHAQDHPGVWRLLAAVITAAHDAGIPAGLCGEWGADPEKLERLVEMGLDSVSVATGTLARVRGWFGER